MKKPREIKRGLTYCKTGLTCECSKCPYAGYKDITVCTARLTKDALAYIEQVESAMNLMGKFGKLFMDYDGCPRGEIGRAAMPIEEEVLLMEQITDVDGGKWIPVNADALHELVEKYKQLEEQLANRDNLIDVLED